MEGIVLGVDQRATVDFALEIGAVTEQNDVQADAIQLNTVDAGRGQVIDNPRIVDMPLNGRDYNQLPLLSAGVSLHMWIAPQLCATNGESETRTGRLVPIAF